ncbi:rubredoxin [Mesosutterella sp. OilRF-GAM-744-9]|uniref:Rubredoxin n=1 Tax=Mesosutterella porci TaxID=2915351 RepID=A0ABS9MS33_9BURK|nr:rubredoxin [Mesosutterella sp. oilRF-744-WT-GAM-9]MCG5031419.1 rubredoxin [Mesosutterella sp. oilRF-744-WT-GAM-9]MCI6530330.1 rubredoxin [Mesosutterella sp.]
MTEKNAGLTNDPLYYLERFEQQRIGPRTRMQCKVCGFVYDPDEGCLEWQVPPGTPFLEVPQNYDCPACGCPHSSFIILDRERGHEND